MTRPGSLPMNLIDRPVREAIERMRNATMTEIPKRPNWKDYEGRWAGFGIYQDRLHENHKAVAAIRARGEKS